MTDPAEADADTGANPDDNDNHTGKFTTSRPDGGSVRMANTGNAASATAWRANTTGLTAGPVGPAGRRYVVDTYEPPQNTSTGVDPTGTD